MEFYYHAIFGGWAVLLLFSSIIGFAMAMQEDKPLAPLVLFLIVTALFIVLAVIPWVWNHLLFSILALIIVMTIKKCYCRIGKRKNA